MFKLVVFKRLGHDNVPTISMLPEAEPRQSFLEPAEFYRLKMLCPIISKTRFVPVSDRLAGRCHAHARMVGL